MARNPHSISTLDEVEHFAASEIFVAAEDRRHPFRNAVLSTVGPKGPDARILVLRKATRTPFNVEFHTDTRSDKVTDIERNGRASVLLWNPELKLQVRLRVDAAMVADRTETAVAWANTPEPARASYNSAFSPGSQMEGTACKPAAQRKPADAKYFGIIRCRVIEMEVVLLRSEGHLRARFVYGEKGRGAASMLVP